MPTRREPATRDLERLAKGELGSVLVAGRYRVDRLLGRGGMAKVYAGHDTVLGRSIALKVLDDVQADESRVLARFLAEARLCARLRHPNIIEVLDFGQTSSGLAYIAMELLEGEDLRSTIEREGATSWERTKAWMLDICAGLEAAHEAGIVHRDLKPSNCFRVTTEHGETIRLLDFGIAKLLVPGSEGERLTKTNHIVGTPEYMSPEQVRGGDLDHRSDIYSAALILGELLTGKLPYATATSAQALFVAHLYERPMSLRECAPKNVDIPAEVVAIHTRALSKDPDDRYADAQSFAAALREVDPSARRPFAVWRAKLDITRARITRRVSGVEWRSYAAAAGVAFCVGAAGTLGLAAAVSNEPGQASVETMARAHDSLATQAVVETEHEPRLAHAGVEHEQSLALDEFEFELEPVAVERAAPTRRLVHDQRRASRRVATLGSSAAGPVAPEPAAEPEPELTTVEPSAAVPRRLEPSGTALLLAPLDDADDPALLVPVRSDPAPPLLLEPMPTRDKANAKV